jgi:hypothetical protein
MYGDLGALCQYHWLLISTETKNRKTNPTTQRRAQMMYLFHTVSFAFIISSGNFRETGDAWNWNTWGFLWETTCHYSSLLPWLVIMDCSCSCKRRRRRLVRFVVTKSSSTVPRSLLRLSNCSYSYRKIGSVIGMTRSNK